MNKKTMYLILCLLGAVVPYTQFVPWLLQHGWDLRLFGQEMLANRIAAFFVLDVVMSAVVVIVFLRTEARALRIRRVWLIPIALLTVGVSLALPLFLYLRQCAIEDPAG
jgi:Terpene cyclase DEP1